MEALPPVRPLDERAMEQTERRLAVLTKPPGSLGFLETLAVWLAGIFRQAPPPVPLRKAVILFAADHGVVAQGVSAYPQAVTAQMVTNFLRGGAAINVLARQMQARLWIADVGVATPLPPAAGLWSCRVRSGSRDLTEAPALTRDEVWRAIGIGRELVRQAAAEEAQLLAFGEMGIGNTTPATALVAIWTRAGLERVVGPGTGLDEQGVARKRQVVAAALQRHRPRPDDPIGALEAVGGLEIAAIVGGLVEAASQALPVVLDGFIVTAAALVASSLVPEARAYWIAGHCSGEPGHRIALDHLGLRPLLDLGMRLGEGTGAVLAFPIVEAAARLCGEMATFEEAGVSGRL